VVGLSSRFEVLRPRDSCTTILGVVVRDGKDAESGLGVLVSLYGILGGSGKLPLGGRF
jgi:hypothetical protein